MFIPDPDPGSVFFFYPGSGSRKFLIQRSKKKKKAPDPGSGSATLEFWISNLGNFPFTICPLTIKKVQFAYFTMCLKGFMYNN
jgi:hypothetical protein